MSGHRKTSELGRLRESLVGHIVASQIFYALPMLVIFLGLRYADGASVNLQQFLKLLLGASLSGFVFALLFWLAVTSRTLKKRQNGE